MGVRGYATIKKVSTSPDHLVDVSSKRSAFIEKKQQFLRGDASSASLTDWHTN